MNAFLLPALFLALFLSASFRSPVLSSSQVVFKLDSLSSHNTSDSLAVSPSFYANLVLYAKYSSIAYKYSYRLYKWSCPNPLGNTLIRSVDGGWTHGFIARNDKRKEIVVSFRGTSSWKDIINSTASDSREWEPRNSRDTSTIQFDRRGQYLPSGTQSR
ncbi:hypothetical protein B0H13DRAFT_2415060 [Mycena leptocephala]|nr:hypothetical protein B0H13DRAFT_2415060 [Mycena leptocephala]